MKNENSNDIQGLVTNSNLPSYISLLTSQSSPKFTVTLIPSQSSVTPSPSRPGPPLDYPVSIPLSMSHSHLDLSLYNSLHLDRSLCCCLHLDLSLSAALVSRSVIRFRIFRFVSLCLLSGLCLFRCISSLILSISLFLLSRFRSRRV